MVYRGAKGVESNEKQTISVGAELGPKIRFGDLTKITFYTNRRLEANLPRVVSTPEL